jgi:MFS transporter, DHA3 family, macrolide efflux protein
VLTLGIFVGLLLGLAAGGSLANLASVRLRWIWALSLAVIVRFLTEAALAAGVDIVEALRVPLLAAAFGILLAGLWANRSYPGLSIAFVGILSNAVVILVNGGYMPIWQPSLEMAGFQPSDVQSAIHIILPPQLDANFLLHLGPFSDIIPIPFPVIRNVASVGDVFLTAGLAFFLFAATLRPRAELEAPLRGRPGPAQTGLSPAFAESAALERPLMLGGPTPGTAAPALVPLPLESIPDAIPAPPALPRPAPELAERVRQHPYVRLALNSSFAALWTGQLVSLFGDRLHQVALAVLVLITTGSALAAGFVFLVATLPNVLFGPFAGTLVDRWEHKEVMIVSDLLRAAVILLIPIAVTINVLLVYPLVFTVTTISIFFRPARVAILPRIVDDEDLLTANSALWIAEVAADVVGYPLAAVFVAALGTALPLAFWIDAATYVGSAVLLTAVIVPPRVREQRVGVPRNFRAELNDGWRFLRNEKTLFANTIQATIGQITIGGTIALSVVYAERVLDGSFGFDFSAIYGFLETGIGLGNLIGGFVIGLIGARFAKGRMIIVGYAAMGLCVLLLAFASELPAAVGLMFGIGVANMVFVIPSQTLFQERTPNNMLGRVVSFRYALVAGAMTFAMGGAGLFAELVPVQVVLGALGLTTIGAGLGGLLVPALRDA